MRTGWLRTLAVTTLLTAACGSVHAPAGNAASASRIPTPPTASAPITRYLALVTLRGSNQLVVRDITDISHAFTVSKVGTTSAPVFISATELSYADGSGLVRTPLAGSPATRVVSSTEGVLLFAWSPDGTTLAYVAGASNTSELHLVTAGQDRKVSSMPAILGGCETQSCAYGSDFRLSYSPDGRYISLMQSFGGPNFRLWTSDGKLLDSNPPGSGYRMSAWSGSSLYFVDANGVAVWRDRVISSFLPRVSWIRPKASPSGGQIVYAAFDKSGWTHIYVVDTNTTKVRELKQARREPVFLTSRYVWYQGERACTAADVCDSSLPVTASGKTYIYDLRDGIESESIITSAADVWPHGA